MPSAYSNPTNYGGAEGLNLAVWATNNLFFEGTMRGLFSMLFGAGIVLMTGRAEARGGGLEVADIYYRRTLWLFAFGVIHGWLILWVGDILYGYGIAGLFLFAFRKVNPRTLIILGVLVLASFVPKYIYEYSQTQTAMADAQAAQLVLDEGGELDDEQQEAIDGWQEILEDHNPPAKKIQERIDGMHGNYFEIIASYASFLVWMQSTAFYLYSFWDTVGMMLIGMGLLKLGVLSGGRSGRFYLTMMIVGYAIGISVNVYETRLLIDNNFDVIAFAKTHLTYSAMRPTAASRLVNQFNQRIWHISVNRPIWPNVMGTRPRAYQLHLTFDGVRNHIHRHWIFDVWRTPTLPVVLRRRRNLAGTIDYQPDLVETLSFWPAGMVMAVIDVQAAPTDAKGDGHRLGGREQAYGSIIVGARSTFSRSRIAINAGNEAGSKEGYDSQADMINGTSSKSKFRSTSRASSSSLGIFNISQWRANEARCPHHHRTAEHHRQNPGPSRRGLLATQEQRSTQVVAIHRPPNFSTKTPSSTTTVTGDGYETDVSWD